MFGNNLAINDEMAYKIFRFLDFNTLNNALRVNKTWYNTILKSFHKTFEELAQNESIKSSPAIFYDNQLYSYQDINDKANQLAHYLINLHFPSESYIGLFLKQSPEFIISILAIMKAGLVYMPISADFETLPQKTIDLLNESSLKLIITISTLQDKLLPNINKNNVIETIYLDEGKQIYSKPTTNPNFAIKPNQLAYVLSTSGSTGTPKKVLIEHRGLNYCMLAHHEMLNITSADKIAAFADISFDASLIEIMMALSKGACLYIVPSNIRNNFKALTHFYVAHDINIAILTPSVLRQLNTEDFPALRALISTGEKTDKSIIGQWSINDHLKSKSRLFINGYGPSESTIATTLGLCLPNQDVHIGTPIPGLDVFILEIEAENNTAPKRVKLGEIGEIYITGFGLARGYADENLTKKKFRIIEHPDNPNMKIRVFQTGDAAKLNNLGQIEIVGRLDRQIKVHGKLIYPEELEACLLNNSLPSQLADTGTMVNNIEGVYIDAKVDEYNQPHLTAYLKLIDKKQELDLKLLYNKIADNFGIYAAPSHWIIVDEIPLTSSKKLDFKRLPSVAKSDIKYLQGPSEIKPREKPDNLESKLAKIWRQLLQIDDNEFQFNVDDNFIELGGTSLQCANLLQMLKSQYKLKLSLAEFLQDATIAGLARKIRRLSNSPSTPLVNEPILLNPSKSLANDPAIFLVHSLMGDPEQDYAKLASSWPNNQPLFGFKARAFNTPLDMDDNLYAIAADYIKAIKQIQSKGPYFLAGWSAGGIIALIITKLLRDMGEKVSLVMVDSESVTIYQAKSNVAYAEYLLDLFHKKLSSQIGVKDSGISKELLAMLPKDKQIYKLFNALAKSIENESPDSLDYKKGLLATVSNILLSILHYRFKPYIENIALITATKTQQTLNNKYLNWPNSVKFNKIKSFHGDHESLLLDEISAKKLASTINEYFTEEKAKLYESDSILKTAEKLLQKAKDYRTIKNYDHHTLLETYNFALVLSRYIKNYNIEMAINNEIYQYLRECLIRLKIKDVESSKLDEFNFHAKLRKQIDFFHYRLQTIRFNFAISFKSTLLPEFLIALQQAYKEFFNDLFEYLYEIIGRPTGDHVILNIGSLANGIVTPYSDINYLILIDQSKNEQYFTKFNELFAVIMTRMGEYSISKDNNLLIDFKDYFKYFDEEENDPLQNLHLSFPGVITSQGLIKELQIKIMKKEDNHLVNFLFNAGYLDRNSHIDLYKTYQDEVEDKFLRLEYLYYIYEALLQNSHDCKEKYDKLLMYYSEKDFTTEINLKEYLSSLINLTQAFIIFLKCQNNDIVLKTNIFEILIKLGENSFITTEECKLWTDLISNLLSLCIEVQFDKKRASNKIKIGYLHKKCNIETICQSLETINKLIDKHLKNFNRPQIIEEDSQSLDTTIPPDLKNACLIGDLTTIQSYFNNHYPIAQEISMQLFLAAVSSNQIHIVNYLESIGVLLTKAVDKEGNTCLHLAAQAGHQELVNIFLQKGLSITYKNHLGQQALHLATWHNQANVVKQLVQKGAPNAKVIAAFGGYQIVLTPFQIAVLKGHQELIEYLLPLYDRPDGNIQNIGNILHLAVLASQNRMLNHLLNLPIIQRYRLLDEFNDKGQTPLGLAAFLGNVEAIYCLQRKKASVNIRNYLGNTPLHWAVAGGQFEVIAHLVALKANLKVTNADGETPHSHAKKIAKQFKKSLNTIKSKDKAKTESQIDLYERIANLLDNIAIEQVDNQYHLPDYRKARIKNLVFQGGGAKSIAYIGALNAIFEKPQYNLNDIKRVAGVSAGAIVASLLAIGFTINELANELQNIWFKNPLFLESSAVNILKEITQNPDSSFIDNTFKVLLKWPKKQGKNIFLGRVSSWMTYNFTSFISDGEILRLWIEELIYTRTGVSHLTFGELHRLIQFQQGHSYKELHVVAAQLGNSPKLIVFNSEDEESEDVIISDAIRASMSIPAIFKPHNVAIKHHGERMIIEDKYYVDGGIIKNFPIDLFDKVSYLYPFLTDEYKDLPIYNTETLGLSLYSPKDTSSADMDIESMTGLTKACMNILLQTEQLLADLKGNNRFRTININTHDVSTTDFTMDSSTQAKLIQYGKEAVEQSDLFKRKSLDIIVDNDSPTFIKKDAHQTEIKVTSNLSDRRNIKLINKHFVPLLPETIPDLEQTQQLTQFNEHSLKKQLKTLDPEFDEITHLSSTSLGNSSQFAIGNSDFKSVIEKKSLLIDKSLFIKEIIDDLTQVKLIIRPRRFGKTFNMSMLKYFFEITEEIQDSLFHDLAIWQTGERYRQEQGQYPVLFITLKDIKARQFSEAVEDFRHIISDQYKKYKKLLFNGILKEDDDEKNDYQKIINREANTTLTRKALKKLSEYLHKQYGKPVIVLIDEYDTPIHASYAFQYYSEMMDFMRGLLGPLLKDNNNLQQAVLTGILQVAHENIFSGLNNLRVYSILSDAYRSYFGFTADEIKTILGSSAIEISLSALEDWYGGYNMGTKERIFNPWSVINFIEDNRHSSIKTRFNTYWINTSENSIIEELLQKADESVKKAFCTLLENKSIVQVINTHTVFRDINEGTQTLWSFLLLSGYLTISPSINEKLEEERAHHLLIPNKEVYSFYEKLAKQWFQSDELKQILHRRNNARMLTQMESQPTILRQLPQPLLAQSIKMLTRPSKNMTLWQLPQRLSSSTPNNTNNSDNTDNKSPLSMTRLS